MEYLAAKLQKGVFLTLEINDSNASSPSNTSNNLEKATELLQSFHGMGDIKIPNIKYLGYFIERFSSRLQTKCLKMYNAYIEVFKSGFAFSPFVDPLESIQFLEDNSKSLVQFITEYVTIRTFSTIALYADLCDTRHSPGLSYQLKSNLSLFLYDKLEMNSHSFHTSAEGILTQFLQVPSTHH
jgi:hypothetical protein